MKHNLLLAVMLGLLFPLAPALLAQKTTLSGKEKDGILFMLEEEKLARDVYLDLKEQYGLPIFANISTSEQVHVDLMKDLAERYKLDIPSTVEYDETGLFNNASLRVFFKELSESAGQSLENALLAGARIEEQDIQDLEVLLKKTKNQDIVSVYQRLISASENHFRAFVRNLESRGFDYSPTILSKKRVAQILTEGDNKGKGKPAACCAKGKQKRGKGCCKRALN